MRKILLGMLCIFIATAGMSQTTEKKVAETTFEVDGVCGMCKERIESAAMRTSGVKLAEWSVETHELKVIYKPSKVSLEEIHQAIADVGHSTETVPADSTAYEHLHACCQYEDEKAKENYKQKVKSGQGHH